MKNLETLEGATHWEQQIFLGQCRSLKKRLGRRQAGWEGDYWIPA
jgi:hypothetical protein